MKKDSRTYADRREELCLAVAKRRKKIKQLSIEHKSGECYFCGYSICQSALDFHHIDPSTKEFGIGSKGYTRSWEKVKEELSKRILVCASCHREIEAGSRKINHAFTGNHEQVKIDYVQTKNDSPG